MLVSYGDLFASIVKLSKYVIFYSGSSGRVVNIATSVCVCVCVRVHACMCLHICIYARVCVCLCVHTCTHK